MAMNEDKLRKEFEKMMESSFNNQDEDDYDNHRI